MVSAALGRVNRTALAVAAILAAPAAADPLVIEGPARVRDGDYLIIGEVHVRLWGIDAFERAQVCGDPAWACGEAAYERLVALTGDAGVRCERRSDDRWGRVVAVCAAGGRDLSAVLVTEGLAMAWRKWSFDYVGAENTARSARAGVWSGPFTFPWDFRREAN